MVSCFSEDGVEKVNSTESTGYERIYVVTSNIDLCGNTAVGEDIPVAQLTKSELTVVGVCAKIPVFVSRLIYDDQVD
jgi:hypothetical protein